MARGPDGRVLVLAETDWADRRGVTTKDELFDRSSEVVLATTTSTSYMETSGLVYTVQKFVVDEAFTGGLRPGDTFELQYPGGAAATMTGDDVPDPAGYFYVQSEHPSLVHDQQYMLFLDGTAPADHRPGARVTVGRGVGAFQVTKGRLTAARSLAAHPVVRELNGSDARAVGRDAAARARS